MWLWQNRQTKVKRRYFRKENIWTFFLNHLYLQALGHAQIQWRHCFEQKAGLDHLLKFLPTWIISWFNSSMQNYTSCHYLICIKSTLHSVAKADGVKQPWSLLSKREMHPFLSQEKMKPALVRPPKTSLFFPLSGKERSRLFYHVAWNWETTVWEMLRAVWIYYSQNPESTVISPKSSMS